MKKISLGILIAIVAAVLMTGIVSAFPVKLPQAARTASPVINEAGELKAPSEFVLDLPESELTKIVFIRYVPGFQKDKACDYNGVCDPDEKGWCVDCKGGEEPSSEPTCYGFLAGSAPRWNWVEDYHYSTSELGITSAWATQTWDDVTSGTIFGNGISESNPWGVYDYKNSISFGNYEGSNVIAVTAIWFRAKNIYEYDIMFDTDYFPDGTEVDSDLETVTLHEFGHGAGLGDLYDVVCENNVMYGYYVGEKTFLGSGDIEGIQKLYGGL